jgi:hypothetical protein
MIPDRIVSIVLQKNEKLVFEIAVLPSRVSGG